MLSEFLSEHSAQTVPEAIAEREEEPRKPYAWYTRAPGEEGIYATPPESRLLSFLIDAIPFARQAYGLTDWRSEKTLMDIAELLSGIGPIRTRAAVQIPKFERVYHGTTAPVFELYDWLRGSPLKKSSAMEYIHNIDRYLGPHVAKDPAVAASFTTSWSGEFLPRGRIIPANFSGKIYKVPQDIKAQRGFITQMDMAAINRDAAETVFPKNKELFITWMRKGRGASQREAEEVWEFLKSGKQKPPKGTKNPFLRPSSIDYMKEVYGRVGFGPFVANEGSLFVVADKLADLYKKYLRARGYDAIQYINTAPKEIADATDFTSYIILHDEPSKLLKVLEPAYAPFRKGGLLEFLKKQP